MNRTMSRYPIQGFALFLFAITVWHFGPLSANALDPVSAKTDSLGDPLPPGALLRLGTQRFHHPSTVRELAVSPDEKSVVTIGTEEVFVWDAATGKMRWRQKLGEHAIHLPSGPAYGVRPVVFAADSARFYTPGGVDEILVWDIGSGNVEKLTIQRDAKEPAENVPFQFLNARPASPTAIDVTSDGRKLLLASSAGIVVSHGTGNALFEIPNPPHKPVSNANASKDRLLFDGIYSFAQFSPNQKLVAAVTSDSPNVIQLRDAETGKALRLVPLKARLVRFAFSPDSRRIVATERDIAARLYDVESGERIWSFEIEPTTTAESYLSAVAYCPDPNFIAVGAPIGADNDIRILDAADGKEVGKLTGHTWKPWTLAAAKASNTLYSSGWDGVVRRWDVAAQRQLPLPQGIRATSVVAASPDGRLLAYADDRATIHLVRANDGEEVRSFEQLETNFSQLVFSADSQHLAGGGSAGDQVRVIVWDLRDGNIVRDWKWLKGKDPHSTVESLHFRPDGEQLAAAVFRQSAAYLWDLSTGDQVAQLAHRTVYGLSFSPDGKTIATAGWDQGVRFWDTSNGELRREFPVREGQENDDRRMYTVCYSPAGGLLATAHLDGAVRIWNAADMELRKEFKVERRFIFGAMAFSPDGSLLATGDMRGEISLWDPQTAELLWVAGQHESYAYTLSFGSDNRTLLSGGADGVGYLWDLHPPGPVEQDLKALWKDLSGQGPTAYRATCALSQTPERTATFVGDKLRRVTNVMDLDRVLNGLTTEEAADRKQLVQILVEKDERVALSSTVRRAVGLLNQLGTPDAMKILNELAERDPNGDLGRLAAAALEQTRALGGR